MRKNLTSILKLLPKIDFKRGRKNPLKINPSNRLKFLSQNFIIYKRVCFFANKPTAVEIA